jgi:hypothetical protein
MTTVYKFKAYYTDAGVGAVQDPAPTCTVINMADDSKLADAQATTASTNMPGLYSYEYSGNDGLDCVAWFKTTDTGCDVKELASYVSEKITTNLNADVAGVETKVDTIDTNVDSILADTGTDGVLVSSGTGAKQISLDAGKVLLQATQTGVTIPTVTSITNGVTLADDAITAAKFDESTAYPVKSADTGATQIARVGADSDTLETLSDQIDGISTGGGSSAAEIWAYSVRTLTQSAASVVATVSGSDITCTRGDSFSASLTDVGALTGYSKVYFTVKKDKDDADAVSIIQIEKTAGLKYIDGGTATTAANGTLTITDEATGDITIALDEAETAKLDGGVYYYDVQIVRSAGTVSTLTSGNFTVSADVTRAVT